MIRARATFECSSCGEVFAAADDLRSHVPAHRLHAAIDQATARPTVAFTCSRCGAGFAGPDELRRHAATHDRSETPPVVPPGPRGPQQTRSRAHAPQPGPAGEHARPVAPVLSLFARPKPHREPRPAARRRSVSALAAIAVVVALLGAGSALAWFTAVTSGSARITTGTWADRVTFAPGCSRAAHWSSPGRPRLEPIATRDDQGVIALDFGDVRPNSDLSWCDVLRVTSGAPDSLSVSFTVTGAVAPLVGGAWFADGAPPDVVGPAQTRRLGLRLVVPKKSPYGTYTGTLAVTIAGDTERHDFPITVTIGKRGRTPPVPAQAGTFVLPHGSPSGSPAPPPPPDASPSPSQTASPSPSPSAPPLAPLFSLLPGTSTALPWPDAEAGPGAEPVAVARLLPNGGITLGFGALPTGEAVVFPDVLRVACTAGTTASVTLALSGPAANAVLQVGLGDDEHGLMTDSLTLDAGAEAQVGFAFDLPADVEPGLREGTLTLTLATVDGSSQQCEVPLTLAIQPVQASPGTSASPSP